MKNRQTGKNLPEGYVRENFYLCYDEDELVGVYENKIFYDEENVFVKRYWIKLRKFIPIVKEFLMFPNHQEYINF